MEQCVDRAHRLGQTAEVVDIEYLAYGPFDDEMCPNTSPRPSPLAPHPSPLAPHGSTCHATCTLRPRAASVECLTDCACVHLARPIFERLLGPVIHILKRNAENYKSYEDCQ